MRENRVLVLNTSEDTMEAIATCLEQEGYEVAGRFIRDYRMNRADIHELFRTEDPAVVLYDIAPPYDVNWAYFLRICQYPEVVSRPVILTCTNLNAVRQLTGAGEGVLELLLKPFDLARMVKLVGVAAGRVKDPSVRVSTFGAGGWAPHPRRDE